MCDANHFPALCESASLQVQNGEGRMISALARSQSPESTGLFTKLLKSESAFGAWCASSDHANIESHFLNGLRSG